MTAGELIRLFRQQANDTANPSLWRDDEVIQWLNDAEVEACRRARLIIDSRSTTVVTGTATTDGPCQVTLVPGTDSYALDRRIIYLRRVKLASRTLPLDALDYRDMDWCTPGWEAHEGNVTGYIRGLDNGRIRIYKIPRVADTVNLLVVREPMTPMENVDDSPEIQSRYHINLLDWAHYRGYMKKDSQAFDEGLALKHLALFEAEFGTRNKATAFEEEWMRNTAPFDEHQPYHHTAGEF
jgi:hypothetical protein